MLGRLFSRPQWQHRNPRVRAEGVQRLPVGDPRLVELARSDSDPAVRRQAIRRLEDPALLAELFAADADGQVRDAAGRRLCRLLTGEDPSGLGPEERRAASRKLTDSEAVTHLLAHADLASMRLDVLARVERQSVLADVALRDPALDVRLAALERIDQISVLERVAKRARGSDKRVARKAREKLADLQARAQRPRRQLELCEALEKLVESGAADVARGRRLEQEWAAVSADAPAAVRDRVMRATAELERVYAEHQAAAEHLARQRELCARAEALLGDVMAAVDDTTVEIRPMWQAMGLLDSAWRSVAENGAINSGCEARFLDALEPARERLSRIDKDRAGNAELHALVEEAQKLAGAPALPGQRALKELESRWDDLVRHHRHVQTAPYLSSFKAAVGRATERIREARGQEKVLAAELERLLSNLDKALADGELHQAISFRDKARDRLGKLQAIGAAHADAGHRRLRRLEGRLGELRDWRRYGLERARRELIERMQGLVGEKTPPPKLATRIHALQEEWRDLDRSNGPAADALWKAFAQAAEQAFAPCKAYFAAQEAQREAHAREREALCSDLEAAYHLVNWEQPQWPAVEHQLRTARKRWRKLGGVDPNTWRRLNRRFHGIVGRFEERLEPERQREKVRREHLIARLEDLADESDLRRAAAVAKEAQAEWQPTVPMSRRVEQALWKRFKAANDAVFARLDARRGARKREQAEAIAARETLCEAAEALARAPLDEARARQDSLRKAWREAPDLPARTLAPLDKRFTQAIAHIERQRRSAAEVARLEQERRWEQRAALCARLEASLESGEGVVEGRGAEVAWAALPPLDDAEVAAQFERRYERISRALSGDEQMRRALNEQWAANLALKERLCLELELLAGIESPPQLAEARLALQVERLTMAMAGGEGEKGAAEDRRASLLRRWYLAGPVSGRDFQFLESRFQRARQALQGASAS